MITHRLAQRLTQRLALHLKRWVIGALATATATSCSAQTTGGDDGWDLAPASAVGLDSGLVDDLRAAVLAGAFTNLDAIVVVKDGRLVLDQYVGEYDENHLHYTASVTKSVASILLGVAIDRGLVSHPGGDPLDLPLAELLPQYRSELQDPEKSRIRLRHVLSMTAGFAWDEDSYPYDDVRNDWVRVRDTDDPVALVFGQPVTDAPGTRFVYSGGLSTIVGALLERASDGSPHEFAEEALFGPLGITEYEWWDLEGGIIDVPGGLHLRPRDMAKVGQLYLDGGIWRGRPIVSERWVEESTREHVVNAGSPNYGLHWWAGDLQYGGRSEYVFMASGHGGQKIFVVPAFDLVAVLAHQVFDNPFGELNNVAIMSRYVLPAADPTYARAEAVQVGAGALLPFVGTYRSARGSFRIEQREGALWVDAENTPPGELIPLGPGRFRVTTMDILDVEFVFEISDDGRPIGGTTYYGFTEDVFERIEAR